MLIPINIIVACIPILIVKINFSEYGEIDPDKVKAAVNTFMRSCAGYSVATYALVSKEIILEIQNFNID